MANEFVYLNATDGFYNVTRDTFTGGINEVTVTRGFWSDVVVDTQAEEEVMEDWYRLLCEAERSEYDVL